MELQLNLFSTGIVCSHCHQDPGPDPRNGYIWDGFWDMDTLQHVCRHCIDVHYREKWKTEKKRLWSEFPVMVK